MIVDSKTSANFMLGYRRPHVVVAHLVHNSHLADPERPDGPLRESRRRVIERLDRLRLGRRADRTPEGRPRSRARPAAVARRHPERARGSPFAPTWSTTCRCRRRARLADPAQAGRSRHPGRRGRRAARADPRRLRGGRSPSRAGGPRRPLGVAGIRLHGHRADARDRLSGRLLPARHRQFGGVSARARRGDGGRMRSDRRGRPVRPVGRDPERRGRPARARRAMSPPSPAAIRRFVELPRRRSRADAAGGSPRRPRLP